VLEISRFFGTIIHPYVHGSWGSVHHTPHFHAYYQEYVGVFGLDPST
jgi:hypothetical protein